MRKSTTHQRTAYFSQLFRKQSKLLVGMILRVWGSKKGHKLEQYKFIDVDKLTKAFNFFGLRIQKRLTVCGCMTHVAAYTQCGWNSRTALVYHRGMYPEAGGHWNVKEDLSCKICSSVWEDLEDIPFTLTEK
jgi:hypothetical protein